MKASKRSVGKGAERAVTTDLNGAGRRNEISGMSRK
jgi:hypothetical protein